MLFWTRRKYCIQFFAVPKLFLVGFRWVFGTRLNVEKFFAVPELAKTWCLASLGSIAEELRFRLVRGYVLGQQKTVHS